MKLIFLFQFSEEDFNKIRAQNRAHFQFKNFLVISELMEYCHFVTPSALVFSPETILHLTPAQVNELLTSLLSRIPIFASKNSFPDPDHFSGIHLIRDSTFERSMELELMLNFHLRQMCHPTLKPPVEVRPVRLFFSNLSYEPFERALQIEWKKRILTPREAQILELLLKRPNQYATTKELITLVWGRPDQIYDFRISLHALRFKLKNFKGRIRTHRVRGVGIFSDNERVNKK